MSSDLPYRDQVSLMLQLLPIVGRETDFALKGGTAINLFVRDLPRLSVDIDLTFLPLSDRSVALAAIHDGMARLARSITQLIPKTRVQMSANPVSPKLVVSSDRARVKIEPNTTLRGSVFSATTSRTTPAVEKQFGLSVRVPVLSFADLYGGKIVAALDRQHPRDLFDVKLLLDEDGLTDDVRVAVIVYLASHGRPMAELLDPVLKPLDQVYQSEFAGMMRVPATLTDLEDARSRLIRQLRTALSSAEREFLLSLKHGEPRWELIPVPHVAKLPAIRWKLRNVQELARRPAAHKAAIEKLKKVLGE
jgi:predicted nucleotidyltransferase component of viral defense system